MFQWGKTKISTITVLPIVTFWTSQAWPVKDTNGEQRNTECPKILKCNLLLYVDLTQIFFYKITSIAQNDVSNAKIEKSAPKSVDLNTKKSWADFQYPWMKHKTNFDFPPSERNRINFFFIDFIMGHLSKVTPSADCSSSDLLLTGNNYNNGSRKHKHKFTIQSTAKKVGLVLYLFFYWAVSVCG